MDVLTMMHRVSSGEIPSGYKKKLFIVKQLKHCWDCPEVVESPSWQTFNTKVSSRWDLTSSLKLPDKYRILLSYRDDSYSLPLEKISISLHFFLCSSLISFLFKVIWEKTFVHLFFSKGQVNFSKIQRNPAWYQATFLWVHHGQFICSEMETQLHTHFALKEILI